MTVQAGIELDLDIAALVGEMEEQTCESCSHDERHEDGPATHYARVQCDCGVNVIKAYCAWMVALIRLDRSVFCFNCLTHFDKAQDHITILAPVKP